MRLLLVMALLLPQIAIGTTDFELFDKAMLFYQHNNIEMAKDAFTGIDHKGARVWANLGTCNVMLGNQADAVGCWLRAQKSASFGEYRFCSQAIDDALRPLGKKMTPSWYQTIWNWCPFMIVMVQILFLVSWYGIIWCFLKRKRGLPRVVHGTLLLFFMVFMVAGYCTEVTKKGLMRGDTPVYVGPNDQFHKKGIVQALEQVRLYDHKDGWYKISFQQGYAWVNQDTLIVI